MTRGLTKMAVLIGFFMAALNIDMVEDWYGLDWLELVEADTEPPKYKRKNDGQEAAHRLRPQRE